MIPGLRRLLLDSVTGRDYTLLRTTTIAFVLTINLLIDLLYACVDPRIKYG